MEQLVRDCRSVICYMGTPSDNRPDSDMLGVRRVAVAARDVAAGTKLTQLDLKWLRSTETDVLRDPKAVIGKYTVVDLNEGQILMAHHLQMD